ncbi:hypothetical protein LAD12857_13810 [Lacrimispora amygdalina]|uniref:Uncharacterized protein n=3 Tax=Lacrimispora amygdalina TaxID=253257 RepID=A0ABQ5M3C4_9FIRM
MRKIKKWTTLFLMTLTVSTVTAPQAMADNSLAITNVPMASNAAMAQLRMEDKGPDFSKGSLISEVWGTEEDGTPYVERTYIEHNAALLRASKSKKYTKTKSYGATGSVEVSARFEYDSAERTVYVFDESGSYNQGGGVSDVEDYGTTTSGDGTSKATAKYSCRVNRNLGGWATYSVSVSCNYKGNKS